MDETSSKDLTISEVNQPTDYERISANAEVEPPRMAAKVVAISALRGILQFSIMGFVLVVATFLMMQLVESRKERPARAQKETVFTVDALVAEPKDNRPMISVYGDIVAGRTLNLTSLVPGEVISMNSKLRVGGRVEKGETILKINPFSFEIARDEALANLKEAEAALVEARVRLASEETNLKNAREQLDLGQKDLDRARDLFETQTLTRRDVETRELVVTQREAQVLASGANIEVQKAQIEAREATVARLQVLVRNAEKNLVNTDLKAPFDGIIQTMAVEVGQTVATNLSLISLYEADTLDARFVLSDGQYGRLIGNSEDLVGRNISVDWQTGTHETSYPAEIDRVAAEITSNRGGVQIFARLKVPETSGVIRPGAFVTVNVPDEAYTNSYRVPETALFEGDVVYVIGEDNRLVAKPVKIAVYDGNDVIISDGLEPGDMVITTQIAEIGEGLLVRLNNQEEGALGAEAGSAKDNKRAELKPNGPKG